MSEIETLRSRLVGVHPVLAYETMSHFALAKERNNMLSIWCLFSVENNYDQPDNNLVRWWATKPSIEALGQFMALPIDKVEDEEVAKIVDLWRGQPTRFKLGGTNYRLQEVKEGEGP